MDARNTRNQSGAERESRDGNERESEDERAVTITRVFDLPARILFLACSKAEHMTQWFGPEGYPLTLCEMDFRVGGKYRFAMTGPDGKQMTPFGGAYLAIEQDRKISYSNALEQPGAESMIVTFTFSENEGKSTLVIHTLFGSVTMKEKHLAKGYEIGVGSGLDQLAGLGARLARS